MAYIIALPCVDVMDRACVDECPVDCIYECGACEPVCPVEAIYYEDDLPEEWSVFESVNAEFFDDIGSPGGAQRLGPTGSDHPYVAGLPPQGE